MDTLFQELSGTNQNLVHEFDFIHEVTNSNFLPAGSEPPSDHSSPSSDLRSSEADYPESRDFSNAILRYISEMLMEEEDLADKPCMLQDCLALQVAEKSLYDVIGKTYPSLNDHNIENIDVKFVQSLGHQGNNKYVPTSNWLGSDGVSNGSRFEFSLIESPQDTLLVLDSSPETQSISHSKKGIREAGKGIRNTEIEVIDLESSPSLPKEPRELEDGSFDSQSGSKGKKNHEREDGRDDLEERSNKQSAVDDESSVPQEMYDEVLLFESGSQASESSALHDKKKIEEKGKLQSYKQPKRSNGKNARQKKRGNTSELVDLRTLLNQCAEAVANCDKKTTDEFLKQIRQHSSPYGDQTQRLAHYFAIALEVRLAASSPLYMTFASNERSAAELLKAYQVYLNTCPFKKMSNFFANHTILKLAEKASRIHIIDFGILYGYQWPSLIQSLSSRTSGPPLLRITGIELPQPGFRPSGRVEETGRRLANYCKRFNVPFEYNGIAQKWETIRYEDLKIDRDDFIAVNCSSRMRHIPDETVLEDCPRDMVLKLIEEINPDIFVHSVVNGTYNAPFFLRRFREALYHFSAFFDIYEATLPREDQQRLLFEIEIFGKDALNVIACEGFQRIDRPETYKQWQVRNIRAGFKQLPLDQEILKKVKNMVKLDYHKDFVVDEDGMWMLQGWKGRIMEAFSCWKPA